MPVKTYLTHVLCATCKIWVKREGLESVYCNECHNKYRDKPKAPKLKKKYTATMVRY